MLSGASASHNRPDKSSCLSLSPLYLYCMFTPSQHICFTFTLRPWQRKPVEHRREAGTQNLSHLTSAGLNLPQTWADFETAVRKHSFRFSCNHQNDACHFGCWWSALSTCYFCYWFLLFRTLNEWWKGWFPGPPLQTDEKQLAYIFLSVCGKRNRAHPWGGEGGLKKNMKTWGPFCLLRSPLWHLGLWLTTHNWVSVAHLYSFSHTHTRCMCVWRYSKGNRAHGEGKLSSHPQEAGLPEVGMSMSGGLCVRLCVYMCLRRSHKQGGHGEGFKCSSFLLNTHERCVCFSGLLNVRK